MYTTEGIWIPNKKVVYTAIFGDYDELKDPEVVPDDVDFVCFTDKPGKSKVWKYQVEPRIYTDPTRCARKYKILSHRFLLKIYEKSMWIDGNYTITGNMSKFIDKYLTDKPISCFDHMACKHDPRGCAYDEAKALLWLGDIHPDKSYKDKPSLIYKQIEKYKYDKYPKNNGLIFSCIILREHQNLKVISTMERWWEELKYNSKRDQLSFNYAAWKQNLEYNIIPGDARDNDGWTRFEKHNKHAGGK